MCCDGLVTIKNPKEQGSWQAVGFTHQWTLCLGDGYGIALQRLLLQERILKIWAQSCLWNFVCLGLMASLSQNPSLWRAGLGGVLQCKSTCGRWEMNHVHQGGPSAWTPHLLCTQVSGSTLVSGRLKLELGSCLFLLMNQRTSRFRLLRTVRQGSAEPAIFLGEFSPLCDPNFLKSKKLESFFFLV